MQLHIPSMHLHRRAPRVPRVEDRIPTVSELSELFQSAQSELDTLEVMHAANKAEYERKRTALINRMGKLIATCEAYYGTDLRKSGTPE